MSELELFFKSKEFFEAKLFLVFVLSGVISYLTIPIILKISKRKNLLDIPKERSSHDRHVSNLGGVALFYSIGICSPIFAYELFESYQFLFPALVILLYVGVMDDIMEVKPYAKLIAQILVAVLMVIGSDVRIKSFSGIFGIYELNYWVSVVMSIFTFIIMINAFNLIDGIDGLAGVFSVICCMFFGLSYYRLGEQNYPMVVLCVVIIGALLSFLYYNLSEVKSRKIFMGDTGSMSIGFLLVFTAFYFMDIFAVKENEVSFYYLSSAPVIAFSVLIVPIMDTLSVIIIRLVNKRSPMKADRNHIHHRLLKLGLTHKKATFYIAVYYVFTIMITYFLRHLEVNLLFLIVLCLGFLGVFSPNIIMKYNKK
ncbi:MAG: MraY family glycosyltransferase [Flavobacteriaceae bacterium]|nr:MraY family glycosyltransferase [Flavobacteriaceae bacterium]